LGKAAGKREETFTTAAKIVLQEMWKAQIYRIRIINDLKNDDDFLDSFSNQMYTQYDFFKICVLRHCDIDEYIIDLIYDQTR
jgi:hypothetical protein